MNRRLLLSLPVALVLVASAASAQEASAPQAPAQQPGATGPATPPQAPVPTQPGPRHDGAHRDGHDGAHHDGHDGPHAGMPHDAVHEAAAREGAHAGYAHHGWGHDGGGSQEGRDVSTTVDSGSKNAILERQVATHDTAGHVAIALPLYTHTEVWEQVCVAPCKVDLNRHSSYRVAMANGVPGTRTFTLTPNKEQIDLRVRPGNLPAYAVGGAATGIGTAALITGAVLLTVAGKFEDESDIRVAGAITGGVGLALLAVGIPLLILNQTHVYADGRKLALDPAAARKRPRVQLGATGLVF